MTTSAMIETEERYRDLGRRGERIKLDDTIADVMEKMCEGNPGALRVLFELLQHSPSGFMEILGLDAHYLYGSRIWLLYKDICGCDLDRFIYHIQMELPNQATGKLSITGRYTAMLDEAGSRAHFAARSYGKPGSFWAMKNPPTDSDYTYPILVGPDDQIIIPKPIARPIRTLGLQDLRELVQRLESIKNPRQRRAILDSLYAQGIKGKIAISYEAINELCALLRKYGFRNHALKLGLKNHWGL